MTYTSNGRNSGERHRTEGHDETFPSKQNPDGRDEMKRAFVIGFSICLLSLASCNRREVATAILAAGFSTAGAERVENGWQRGLLPEDEVREVGNAIALSPLDEVWRELQQLRERIVANSQPLPRETFDDLI